MTAFSLLDLAPVPEGSTVGEALRNTLDLAPRAESAGYLRYWLAEHHNMAGIASSATAVLIGQVAAVTKTMRVGAGGIMLPNHSPLIIAEQFGTLGELFPGRIDLGLGRAPGTDMNTARALHRLMDATETFPNDVETLLKYLGDADPKATLNAIPGTGTHVPIWILGSSLYGAQLAAYYGLPYSFASHFAPTDLAQASAIYRERFRPSRYLDKPYFMLAANVFAADSDEEGRYLMSSMALSFAKLRTGNPGQLPRPVENWDEALHPQVRASVETALSCSAAGSPDTVRKELATLIGTFEPDEIILTGQIHDHQARVKSFELAADIMRTL